MIGLTLSSSLFDGCALSYLTTLSLAVLSVVFDIFT